MSMSDYLREYNEAVQPVLDAIDMAHANGQGGPRGLDRDDPRSHRLVGGRAIRRSGAIVTLPDRLNVSATVHQSTAYEVDENGCWLWTGWIDHQGYGHIRRHPLEVRAHRAFYADVHGPIPAGHHIHHRCEVKRCVNPDHLEALSPTTHLRTHWHEEVELTDEVREQIREAARDPELTMKQIGERFGVPRSTVNKIIQGYSWFDGEAVEVERPLCPECGERVTGGNRHKRFCCPSHRNRYNARLSYRRSRESDEEHHG